MLIAMLITMAMSATMAHSTLALPTDCRNQTLDIEGGLLPAMSYHIHYTYDTAAMAIFDAAFKKQFASAGATTICPFGPNYAAPYSKMCALEDCSKGGALSSGTNLGGSPWNDPQVRGERSENVTLSLTGNTF